MSCHNVLGFFFHFYEGIIDTGHSLSWSIRPDGLIYVLLWSGHHHGPSECPSSHVDTTPGKKCSPCDKNLWDLLSSQRPYIRYSHASYSHRALGDIPLFTLHPEVCAFFPLPPIPLPLPPPLATKLPISLPMTLVFPFFFLFRYHM